MELLVNLLLPAVPGSQLNEINAEKRSPHRATLLPCHPCARARARTAVDLLGAAVSDLSEGAVSRGLPECPVPLERVATARLWWELFVGWYSIRSVHRALAGFPRATSRHALPPRSGMAPHLSASQVAWLLVRPAEDLTAPEEAKRAALCEKCEAAAVAYPLSQRFGRMLRERRVEQLESWLTDATTSGVPELRNFAASVRRDELHSAAR